MQRPPPVGRSPRGQGTVELALVLPIALLFIVGIFDFGYYMFVNISINNSLKGGLRMAQQNLSTTTKDQVKQKVVDGAVGVNLPLAEITVTTTNNDATADGNHTVTVAVAHTHTFMISGLFPTAQWPINISYKGTLAQYEQTRQNHLDP